MDWNAAIDKHREALKRVLAALVSMAGAGHLSPPIAGEKAKSTSWLSQVSDFARGGMPPTLPRHLHRAVLRLLRPAEAAARRLVIVAARGVSSRFAEGKSVVPVARWKASERRDAAQQRGPGREGSDGITPAYPARIPFPLFDPPRCSPDRRRRQASRAFPRISVPGYTVPAPLPKPPAPDDAIDARRLTLRLAALARTLDDLPREARRFARWRSRVAAGAQNRENLAGTQNGESAIAIRARLRRIWPLRSGRPPGQLSPASRRPKHAVHQILEDIHGLAFDALKAPDTS